MNNGTYSRQETPEKLKKGKIFKKKEMWMARRTRKHLE